MKTFAIVLAAMAFLATIVNSHAQSDILIKQKARQLGNQPPPRGPAPAAPSAAQPAAPAPTPAPTPSGPAMAPEQLQLIDKLTVELSGIKAGTVVTTEQKQSLNDAAVALAKASAKPSKESVAKLVADLSSGLTGKDVTTYDHSQLAKAINVVMNSASMTAVQNQSALTAAQNVLKAGNVADADFKAIMADLRSIAAELQKSKPSLYR